MCLVGLADNIWSEVVLSSEENTWRKGGDADVWNFGAAVEKLSKKFWHFGLKGVAVADSDWHKDDWESVWTEERFDLGKENGGAGLEKLDFLMHGILRSSKQAQENVVHFMNLCSFVILCSLWLDKVDVLASLCTWSCTKWKRLWKDRLSTDEASQ